MSDEMKEPIKDPEGEPLESIGIGSLSATGTLPSGIMWSPFSTTATTISPAYVVADVDALDERIKKAIEEKIKDIPYSDSLYAHLERAKDESLRRGIEADTVIIDRGVAVSEGIGHAKMVLGLKVKYSKEGSLPMGAAFAMLKTRADAGLEPTPEEDEAWKEKEEAEREKEKKLSEEKTGIIKRSAPGWKASSSMFIYYTGPYGASSMVNVNHIVDVADQYRRLSSGEEWYGLELTVDVTSGSSPHTILIRDKNEAKEAWDVLLHAGRFKV